MTGYATIESNVLAILQGLARFAGNTDAITQADYRPLDSGNSEVIVLEEGGFEMDPPEPLTGTEFNPIRWRTWQIIVNIYERYTADRIADRAAFLSLRDDVLAEIERYPKMGDASRFTDYMTIAADGDPTDLYAKDGGGPFWRTQALRLRVREMVYLETGDYS